MGVQKLKLIIFDLDGVLIESKDIHFHALNKALPDEFKISYEDHLANYDGLPTRKKLQMLSKRKGLLENEHSNIAHLKQANTVDVLKEHIKPNQIGYLMI